jgi:hypothetical protein
MVEDNQSGDNSVHQGTFSVIPNETIMTDMIFYNVDKILVINCTQLFYIDISNISHIAHIPYLLKIHLVRKLTDYLISINNARLKVVKTSSVNDDIQFLCPFSGWFSCSFKMLHFRVGIVNKSNFAVKTDVVFNIVSPAAVTRVVVALATVAVIAIVVVVTVAVVVAVVDCNVWPRWRIYTHKMKLNIMAGNQWYICYHDVTIEDVLTLTSYKIRRIIIRRIIRRRIYLNSYEDVSSYLFNKCIFTNMHEFDNSNAYKGNLLYAMPVFAFSEHYVLCSNFHKGLPWQTRPFFSFSSSFLFSLFILLKSLQRTLYIKLPQNFLASIYAITLRHTCSIIMLLTIHDIELNPGPQPEVTIDINHEPAKSKVGLTIITLNCRGLGNIDKFRLLLNKAYDHIHKNNCIIMLQETMVVDDTYINLA